MKNLFYVLVPLFATGLLLLPVIPVWRGVVTGKKAKHRLITNLCMFGFMVTLALFAPFGLTAAAEEATTAAATSVSGLALIGIALPTFGSCIGAGIAVKSAATAAIGAISENPKSFGKAIIFVALGEGVALYGMLISILMLGKI